VLINQILNLKSFNLFGVWSNKKFFRPSEIKKLSNLNNINLKIETVILNSYTQNYFFKTLSQKKIYA